MSALIRIAGTRTVKAIRGNGKIVELSADNPHTRANLNCERKEPHDETQQAKSAVIERVLHREPVIGNAEGIITTCKL